MKRMFILFLVLLSLYSCKRNIVLTGTVRGRVSSLTSVQGEKMPLSGITIRLISPVYGEKETTTDANGFYEFTDVTTGYYEIILGSDPIGEYHYNFKFVGGEEPYVLPPVKLTYRSTIEPYDLRVDGSKIIVKFRPPASESSPQYLAMSLSCDPPTFTPDVEESVSDSCIFYVPDGTYSVTVYGTSIGEHSVYRDSTGQIIDPAFSEKFLQKTVTVGK